MRAAMLFLFGIFLATPGKSAEKEIFHVLVPICKHDQVTSIVQAFQLKGHPGGVALIRVLESKGVCSPMSMPGNTRYTPMIEIPIPGWVIHFVPMQSKETDEEYVAVLWHRPGKRI